MSWTCDPVLAHKIPSHSLKKSRPLWLVMMDDNTPTHERRKLAKIYTIVLPRNRIVVAEVCGKTYSKNDKKIGVKKRPQNVKIDPTK